MLISLCNFNSFAKWAHFKAASRLVRGWAHLYPLRMGPTASPASEKATLSFPLSLPSRKLPCSPPPLDYLDILVFSSFFFFQNLSSPLSLSLTHSLFSLSSFGDCSVSDTATDRFLCFCFKKKLCSLSFCSSCRALFIRFTRAQFEDLVGLENWACCAFGLWILRACVGDFGLLQWIWKPVSTHFLGFLCFLA